MFTLIQDFLTHLIWPIRFLLYALSFLPPTITHLLSTRQHAILLSPSRLQNAWFARFWASHSTRLRTFLNVELAPLFEMAHGIVLDVGAGSGQKVGLFDRRRVTKVFGVEPNTDMHEGLGARVKEAGLEGIYEVLGVGVERLDMQKESVDCVVTVLCLCRYVGPCLSCPGVRGDA